MRNFGSARVVADLGRSTVKKPGAPRREIDQTLVNT